MSETNLEQVKKLVEQLQPEDRTKLWDHIAKLPDSGINIRVLPSASKFVQKIKLDEKSGRFRPVTFQWGCKNNDGEVIFTLDEVEIFRTLFNAENCANVLFEKIKPDESFLKIGPKQLKDIFAKVRAMVTEQEAKVSDAQLSKLVQSPFLKEVSNRLVKQSLESATKRASDNLPAVVAVVLQKVVHAISFSASNILRERLELPETKYSAKEVIDAVFRPDMELVKILAGVTQGGKRKRKSKFVWDAEKTLKFYQTVEALPRYGVDKISMWEYARGMLRDNDYDDETIQFLLRRPMFTDVPDSLLKEAAKVWRKYDESWDSLPAKYGPQAFAYRQACHILNYPEYAYNTLNQKYYEGRKVSKGRS